MRPNTSVLQQLIPLADAHEAADEYRAGYYWKGSGRGTGCSVGCTIHDAKIWGIIHADVAAGDHAALGKATGMPEMVWKLTDAIFEGLPDDARPAWTPRFLRAAAACRDINPVPARIMARLAGRLAEDAIRDDVREASLAMAELWRRRAIGDELQEIEWDEIGGDVALRQAFAGREQARKAWQQANAALRQANAGREQFWAWCADMVCHALEGV